MRMADGTDWTCVLDPDRNSTSGLQQIYAKVEKADLARDLESRAEFTKHLHSHRRPQRVRPSVLLGCSLWCRPSRKTWMWCAFGPPATATKTSPVERSVTIQTEHPCRMPPDYTGFWSQVAVICDSGACGYQSPWPSGRPQDGPQGCRPGRRQRRLHRPPHCAIRGW